MKPAVLNASPLIVLARAGYLDLVPKLVSSAVVPRAVATEVIAGPAEDPAVKFLAKPSWLTVVDLNPSLSPLADRARRFRDDRLSGVVSRTNGRPLRTGPSCVVHLIPLASIAGRASVDVRPLYYEGYQAFMFADWGGATRDFNLDGLVVYPGSHTADIAYSQIFRTGAMEAARYAGALNVEDPEDETVIWSGTISDLIRDSLIKFFEATKRWNIAGPAIAAAALLNIDGFLFVPPGRYTRKAKSDRPNLVLPEVWIDQLAAINDPDEFARPLLDMLWQAFGIERCMYYNAEGQWVRQ